MKKCIAAIAVLAMFVLLVGCNNKKNESDKYPIEKTTEGFYNDNVYNETHGERTEVPTVNAQNSVATSEVETHKHVYSSKLTSEANCTDDGIESFTCSCGHSYTEIIKKTGHTWEDATCTTPKTCKTCGKKEGYEKGHTWKAATCEAPKTCTVCDETEGSAAGHTWKSATCVAPKTCTVCGEKEGSAADHTWKDATCEAAKTCTACGKTEGSAAGHSWKEATCTTPKTCQTCRKTEGTTLAHSWVDATCTKAKHCRVCSVTSGSTLPHNYSGGYCTMCSKADPSQPTVSLSGSLPIKKNGYKITSVTTSISGTTLYVTLSGVRESSYLYTVYFLLEVFSYGYTENTASATVNMADVSVGSSFTKTIAMPDAIRPDYYTRYVLWVN